MKKTTYLSILSVFCFIVISLVLVFSIDHNSKAVMASVSGIQTVIIDAGHGGVDGGAVGFNGVYEKDINLKIAKNLKSLFVLAGYKVIMTRDTDISIHDKKARSIRDKKVSDLKNRLKLINKTENAVLISIHQNTFTGGSQYWGAQVFYSDKDEESFEEAKSIQNTIKQTLQPENNRVIKKAQTSAFVLYNTKIPAVMVECGFLSNEKECNLLCNEDYQKKMAFAIFSGYINKYN